MKRITSLLLAVLMTLAICTISVSASEESATQHYNEARTFEQSKAYIKAAEKYKQAAEEYYNVDNLKKAAFATAYAGSCYEKTAESYDASLFTEAFGYIDARELRDGRLHIFYEYAGRAYKNATILYSLYGEKDGLSSVEKKLARLCQKMGVADDYFDTFDTNEVSFNWDDDDTVKKGTSLGFGSVLTEGNIWIIVGIVAVGGIVTLIIVKKKKKPAVADGAEKVDEE